MHVRVLTFGVSKDWLGAAAATVELPEGASVVDLLERLRLNLPARLSGHGDGKGQALRGIAVSVNAEYATAGQVLRDGDEVGLLPPVSGGAALPGAARTARILDESLGEPTVIALTREPIDAEKPVAAAKHGEDGAVVVFDGIVRNNTRGRQTLHLDYEAYEEMALRQMKELAELARNKFDVRQVTMIHRLGRLEVGETSVLIVVASAHRGAAFEACHWLIDTLKKTVPIWKKETFVDGAAWADGEPFPAGLAVAPEASHEG
jgi:molybdopterin synthase catalytic subunit